MKCKECPYSLACLADRLHDVLQNFAICPACERVYGFLEKNRGVLVPGTQEYLLPSTPTITFKCQKRPVSLRLKKKWRNISAKEGTQYARGWRISDPIGRTEDTLGMMARACPECTEWPDFYIIEDLDKKTEYATEKETSTPAFRLRGKEK